MLFIWHIWSVSTYDKLLQLILDISCYVILNSPRILFFFVKFYSKFAFLCLWLSLIFFSPFFDFNKNSFIYFSLSFNFYILFWSAFVFLIFFFTFFILYINSSCMVSISFSIFDAVVKLQNSFMVIKKFLLTYKNKKKGETFF